MGEQGPIGDQDPMGDDQRSMSKLVQHAHRTARELNRLVPPLLDAHGILRDPTGRTVEEVAAALEALRANDAAREAALPAAHTLAEAGQIVDDYANKPEGDK